MTGGGYDLLVIGGGAAGLAAAREGAKRGRATVLVQDGPVGGDCTFTGCVPSKTLIEKAASGSTFEDAMAAVQRAVASIAQGESADVLRGEGIEVVEGLARFDAVRTVRVAEAVLQAPRIVVAAGSSPSVPPVPGLSDVEYLTNENVFAMTELPGTLAVLGGGAIGCELAQAFRRLGAEVRLFEAEERLLPREEPEASAVVADALAAAGVKLHLGSRVVRVEQVPVGASAVRREVCIHLAGGSSESAERLLVAVGRRPATAALGLEEAGIETDTRGNIRTDRHLATSSPGVYAAGDVTGRLLFTHAADEMGRLAVRNAFGRLRKAAFDPAAIPRVTFTDPEVAHVGMSEAEAAGHGAKVAFVPMASVDRAITAGRTEGFVKLIAGPRKPFGMAGGGRVLGATIVAPRAGEMIHEVSLAMRTGMFTGRIAQAVHAYPTWSVALRQAAAQFFSESGARTAHPATAEPAARSGTSQE